MYAQVIIDITHEKLDRVFTYCIPSELEGMLQIGMEVLVPFGASNKERHAYVVGFSDTCDFDTAKIKTIQKILEERVGAEAKLVALAAWMKEHYGGTMIQALKTVIPVKKKEKPKQKKYVRRLVSEAAGRERLAFFEKKSQKARARLMEALLEDEEISYDLVTKKIECISKCRKDFRRAGDTSGSNGAYLPESIKTTEGRNEGVCAYTGAKRSDREICQRLCKGDS